MCANGCSFCALLSTCLLPSKRTCASSWLLPWRPGSWHRWSGPQWGRPPQMSPGARGSNAGGQSHHVCDAGAHRLVCKTVENGKESVVSCLGMALKLFTTWSPAFWHKGNKHHWKWRLGGSKMAVEQVEATLTSSQGYIRFTVKL